MPTWHEPTAQGVAPAKPALCVLGDAEAVASLAASRVADAVREASNQRGRFCIAFAGGDTPRRLYERLAADACIDWSRSEFFWGDERSVPPEHPESNFGMVRDALLARLGVASKRVHRIEAERGDLESVARDYETLLVKRTADSRDALPRLDLVLLGIGEDGHTASLFPYTRALSEARRYVVANEVPQLRTRRVTITFSLIECARAVIVLVSGASKAGVLAEILEGPRDPDRLPAQRIPMDTQRVSWLVDAAAASRLRDPVRRPER
jgi:6-phosphogluconolactonase